MAGDLKAANRLESKLESGSVRAGANRAAMVALLGGMRAEEDIIRQGGGEKAAEAQRAKGRLTVRERLALLLDRDSEWTELGLWAAHGMYAEFGGAPGAGVVTGLGRVEGRLCMIVANDATVKAGAFFPMTAKKVLRAQTIALENRIPTLYLVDSSGVFLPLQEDVFPDQDDFGRVFRNNAVMSSLGVPQITAIMGMCVAGGAYLPVMTDTVLMTEGSGLFLAGPALVQAAIGQKTPAEELGGAQMHAEISGTVDFKEPNDHLCIARLRSLVGKLGSRVPGARAQGPGPRGQSSLAPEPWALNPEPFSRIAFDAERDKPRFAAEDLYGLMDPDPAKASTNSYDVREVIARMVDRSEFDEYKAEFGRTLVCGYARIGGRAVGIVSNQKQHQQQTVAMGPQAGTKRTEFGGVIYTESAQKAARFIMDCNQQLVPLVFLHDVNGFMVGKDAEWSGIIRAGAKMVSAVSTSVVPKITVILGGSFGAGHYAMCGKAYDPRFLFAWPTARYAVMSGASAANTLVEVRVKQLERAGKVLSAEEKAGIYDEIKATYDAQADPRYGAARLWIDAIIDPVKTREVLMTALEACAMNPEVPKFNPGVLQT
ncbi:acyl-CoA carboxylase subunit beta [Granulicella mallensis]|uniref:Methylcrotonoyl-CoA carboxylase n=1 Tax=Granulicella mallensis (strain ATCC BAA-1857 / DSM 23137 / MP5ACTX8) TaxID=682795 RepID=G8P1A7_GRAMM|nr:acyl-CoA carboxylase subunit beta [Granulicella mallensis]AEU38125.1 Methylcrotonoyl-CoA carboxylase [Granulicella mallensis MP5ACTX8]